MSKRSAKLITCLSFIFIFQANTLNIELLSSYRSFVQSYNQELFLNGETLYFEDEYWYSMNLDFSNFETLNNSFATTCNGNSSAAMNSEGYVVCVTNGNTNINIYDINNDFALIMSKPIASEYQSFSAGFYDDFIVLENNEENGEGFAVYNALNGEFLYTVPLINSEGNLETICPQTEEFYYVVQGSSGLKVEFYTYYPQNKSQSVDLTIKLPVAVNLFEPLNQSEVFMVSTSNSNTNVEALVGVNLQTGAIGIPTVVKGLISHYKLNDTHVLVQHGTNWNTISLYYVSQNLSVVQASSFDLTSWIPHGFLPSIQLLGGSEVILIVSNDNNANPGPFCLFLNVFNMEVVNFQFGSGFVYPAEIKLSNGSILYLPSEVEGYYIGNGVEFPSFIQNGQKGLYTNPSVPNSVWTISINKSESSSPCSLTNFEESGIKSYNYENCPCETSQPSVYTLTSLVGNPESNDFMFAYICGGVYVYAGNKFYGNFNPAGVNMEQHLLTLINDTSVSILNVETPHGVRLYTYNYDSSEANILILSPANTEPSIIASKISEEVFLFTYPSTLTKSVIEVFDVVTAGALQTVNVTIGNPYAVYPFLVNEGSLNQPVEAFLFSYEQNENLENSVVTTQGEVINFENGEFVQLLSSNSIVMNNFGIDASTNSGFMELMVYEINSGESSIDNIISL